MVRILAILALLWSAASAAESSADIALRADCPPGFELDAGHCELRSLYQMYNSLQGAGMGGPTTGLPDWRDGFTPQQTDLGRYLFFDPVLSRDGSVSCATCHHPDKGFADGRAVSVGIDGHTVTRSAPTLWNVGFLKTLFWDARSTTLEEQATGPLYSSHEMGNNPQQLLETLNAIALYRKLFAEAFPGDDEIALDEIYSALTAFQVSLVSLNSRYDQYAHGYHEALTEPEIEGMNIFRSFVARCAECHTPPLFTNGQIAVIGTPEPEGMAFDPGAQVPMNERTQRGGFKIPTLRNIELTAPYMHSGRFETLRETVAFYTGGRGHAVPEGEELVLHWHIWEPNLTNDELDRLVDFMKTLTDESFKPKTPERLPSGLALVHDNPPPARGHDDGEKTDE
ncbi:cytochrome-c peroxidase [Halioglobus sp. HI00S01]|uniref:cytochrome-c peroxidase n=1 Tax=Halioglobus sp. HI00S01 TaxID=1822214 RepID=UPI0007C29E8C|nr:cytochrome-c peroxidase [Halioglobus sp. HI00S01]